MAGKQERQRRLARERYARRIARQAERQQAVRRTTTWVAGGVVVLVLAGVVAFTLTHLGKKSASALGTPSATPSLSTPPATSTPTPTPTPTTAATEPARHCDYVPSGTAARPVGGLPPATPAYKATYQATIKTNRGNVVIDLLNSKATCTVNSFVFLAGKSYFDNTHCHRLTTTGAGIYVLQCGDPTGTGSGGPGFEFADENLAGAKYSAGTVAMANAGANTNGSQFFLVYKDTPLPPSYTPFGTIVSGLGIIAQVASAGTATGGSDGPPKEAVVIQSITIKKT